MEQDRYQVRFDWAAEGCAAISEDADVIVWVDAIPTPAPWYLSPRCRPGPP